ncbi:23S rRNA (uracil(1939)-C(5))-methyltransferase RlmD [[Mycoplasma] anseris]|uniref:23S rRNA (Uracil(1939)-C(5))-methyltransferase RlmD n=1 Tax=[Mycoplasma] anseris TaxID=92400 RepID=A0A2Z4ND22_9BACT|nr:23S rRNA (uracil(1939)-C(5))-methyltransferase RlmD [[Mycoplasma] anseris]AWX69474.1 23S rRNA (uracil(1939)-C(5))-methyltransferase RlmD [[Mycoplasma] anseris]
MEYKIGQILKNQETTELSYEGYGVIRTQNFSIFVENMLNNEIADIKLTSVYKKYAFAKIEKIIKKSSKRIEIKNKELYAAGSAPLLSLNYQDQLEFKQKIVADLFKRNCNYKISTNIIPSKKQFEYRNKLTLQILKSPKEIKFGFYERKSHLLIEQTNFDLALSSINQIAKEIISIFKTDKEFLNWANICDLQNITIRTNEEQTGVQIIFAIFNDEKSIKDFISKLKEKIDFNKLQIIVSIFEKNLIKIKKTYLDNEEKFLEHILDGNHYLVDYNSFYQINESQMKKMFNLLIKHIDFKNKNIIDAYSGIGIIGCYLSKYVNNVLCLEINPTSEATALINCKNNNITNLKFNTYDASKYLVNNNIDSDIIIFDPPRNGLTNELIDSVIKNDIKEIAYISCNVRTLIRDLQMFLTKGYEIKFAQVIDMFPQTYHIEMLVILKKRNQ